MRSEDEVLALVRAKADALRSRRRRYITAVGSSAVALLVVIGVAAAADRHDEVAVMADIGDPRTGAPTASDGASSCDAGLPAMVEARKERAVRYAAAPSGAGSIAGPSHLADVLPNVNWAVPGEGTKPLNTRVVVGRVIDVADGVAVHRRPPADDPDDKVRGEEEVIGFGDSRAYLQTLTVTIDIEEVLAGPRAEKIVVEWHLLGRDAHLTPPVAKEDPGLVKCALREVARAVWFVSEDLPHYDDTTVGTATFAVLDQQRNLDFPFMHGEAERTWLGNLKNLDALRAEVAKPERSMRFHDGRYVPE